MKFPRIPHLPFSPGVSDDDERLKDLSIFHGKDVIVTEKIDGENISMHRDKIHARSEDSQNHTSRNWIKNFHAQIKDRIPKNIQMVGEYMYAQHSIHYDKLGAYYYVFAAIDKSTEMFLPVDMTQELCESIGLCFVPEYWLGGNWGYIEACLPQIIGKVGIRSVFQSLEYQKSNPDNLREGFVIRTKEGFSGKHIGRYCAKYVRAHHVQTDAQWKRNWKRNKLATE
jgi:hypothetical protein